MYTNKNFVFRNRQLIYNQYWFNKLYRPSLLTKISSYFIAFLLLRSSLLSVSFPEKLFGELLLRKTEITYSGWSHKLIFFPPQPFLLTVNYASGLEVSPFPLLPRFIVQTSQHPMSDFFHQQVSRWSNDVKKHKWTSLNKGSETNKLCNQT
jgi:hypothetical protein